MQVIPAILPHNFEELNLKLARIKGFTNRVQVDICDGEFGAEKTWIPDGTEVLSSEFTYEFDVMLNDWKVHMLQCLALNAVSIIAHVDNFSDKDIETLVSTVSPHNVSLGICVSNHRGLDFHRDMIQKTKSLYSNVFIQVMGIRHIGQQGQPFDEETPSRVMALKQHFPDIVIQVDGGVNVDTIKILKDAGVDSVIAGSSVFGGDDAGAALEALKRKIV